MMTSKRIAGFSLLEVMVALIIISIGMLGIAKMQGLSLSSTSASRARALAAIEASSLASAMQANRAYWSSTNAPALVTITTSAGGATFSSSNGALATAITNAGSVANLCPITGVSVSCYCAPGNLAPCTPAAHAIALAASDIWDFSQSVAGFVPSAITTITCVTTDNPIDCTISITGSENTVALTSQEATQSVNNGSTVQVNFTLYVVP